MDVQERDELAVIDGLLDECARSQARAAAEEAQLIRLLARAWDVSEAQRSRIASAESARRDLPLRSIAAQLGAELRQSDRTVQARLYEASRLVNAFPATLASLAAGHITRAHAAVVVEWGDPLGDDDLRARFEAAVLERAAGDTVGRTRAFAARLAEQLTPRPLQERHDEQAGRRAVWVCDDLDGMSELRALLPTTLAHGIIDRLTRQAKAIRGLVPPAPGGSIDERTLHQVRADVLADLLLTGAPAVDPTVDADGAGLGAIRAHVQLTVPVTTLTGVTDGGAELDGRAPVDAATARRLAGGAPGWDRVMTHPVTGFVLAVDRYRPTAEQRRFLAARDVHCRWPGCRTPARRCQIDHAHEHHDGGATDVRNLSHLCVRHHTLKTETAWTVVQEPGGTLRFTAPTGRHYRGDPPRRIVFLPEPDRPPDRLADRHPDDHPPF